MRDCFEGIFNTLSDLSALGAPVQVVQEAPRSQVFLQWSCPSSGILEATDTFTFDASGKIKNQNVVLLTAETPRAESDITPAADMGEAARRIVEAVS